MPYEVINLTAEEFVAKIEEIIEDVTGWGTVYDIDHNQFKITSLVGDALDSKIYVSPVISEMPAAEFLKFVEQVDQLAGSPWISTFPPSWLGR